MSDEQVERVARAIFAVFPWTRDCDPDEDVYLWTIFSLSGGPQEKRRLPEVVRGPAWRKFECAARAAIRAAPQPAGDVIPKYRDIGRLV